MSTQVYKREAHVGLNMVKKLVVGLEHMGNVVLIDNFITRVALLWDHLALEIYGTKTM